MFTAKQNSIIFPCSDHFLVFESIFHSFSLSYYLYIFIDVYSSHLLMRHKWFDFDSWCPCYYNTSPPRIGQIALYLYYG